MRKAVGFYWTLPVPWAGFHDLPKDVEEAAKVSKTIRYQMHLVRNYAKAEKLDLVAERVFVELQPDRPSPHIREPLEGLAVLCRAQRAELLYADFSKVQGWRSHHVMRDWLGQKGHDIEHTGVWPDSVSLDGLDFDPYAHFEKWKDDWNAWKTAKAARGQALLAEITALRSEGKSYAATAEALNRQGLNSPIGRPWTAEAVRKFTARNGS
ncbi:MAG: hypothetical protein GW858_14070 [Sphingomonadales bacterium]|nr:hypothetical protein [Sphingomonadales bacterium]NCQ21603.1 hypothetical protein [Sphingomonadales bacterium]NCT04681.1 hypothetical protein [Sphingomonadales bacterium]